MPPTDEGDSTLLEEDTLLDVQTDFDIPTTLPLLPVRDIVVFPFMVLPLFVGRDSSIQAVNEALAGDRMMFLLAQKDSSIENPAPDELYKTGTVAMVIRMLKLPDGRVKILVQGLSKATVKVFNQREPFYNVDIEKIEEVDEKVSPEDVKGEAMMLNVRKQLEAMINLGKQVAPDILVIAENLNEPGKLADLMAANLGLKVEDAQTVLEITKPRKRLKKVSELLSREIELLSMQQKIQSAAQEE
ncbi:ATP-dependent protease La Type I, partial [hydrothermal vent metagenome]